MVKIAVVGTGYVGLVSGTAFAEIGHEVICCDISEKKIEMLKNGEIPIYEVGLKELVDKNVREGRLSFTTEVGDAIKKSEVVFSAVGTPPDENHKADLKFVKEVAKTFAENLNGFKVFVNKSTVPVGTGDMVREVIESKTSKKASSGDFAVVSNPEFLREGAAVKDFLNPDRIVVGVENEKAKNLMEEVYNPLVRSQSPLIFTTIKSAELIKYASNAFLATKISFINEIAKFCDIVGADVLDVAKGMGSDKRIGGRFLQAGIGYGGSCFPKDVDALYESGLENDFNFEIIKATRNVNSEQKLHIIEKIKNKYGQNLEGKKLTVWGLAFKPRTDDVREAPSSYIIRELNTIGVIINAFDPIAEENYKEQFSDLEINYFDNSYDALKDSNGLLLLTEWDEFRTLDYERINSNMKDKVIFDGRNIYDKKILKEKGIEYIGIGR